MANKKVLIGVAIASALLIGGGIFWWVKNKKKGVEESGDETGDIIPPNSNTPSSNPTGNTSNTTPSNPLGNTDSVKRFQDWLDVKYPTWLNGGRLNKGSGYGNFGSNTQRAYSNYGAEYKSGSSSTSSSSASGFRVGNKLYTKKSVANVYKYPENVSKNRLGYITQSATSQATFKADANTKGYVIAVAKYKTPDGLKEVVGDVYILASDVTNVAP